jgi:transcriptional regulator
MYIPDAFIEKDRAKIREVIDKHGFGILVCEQDGELMATHIPFLYRVEDGQEYLYGHVARNNPQWKAIAGKKVMVIFAGPHGYISPAWYENPLSVPTWDHISIHMYGVPEIIPGQDQVRDLLTRTTDHFERYNGTQWKFELPQEFSDKLMNMIVAFRIKVVETQAQFKLSQNRAPADKVKVIAALKAKGDPDSVRLAHLIENRLPVQKNE